MDRKSIIGIALAVAVFAWAQWAQYKSQQEQQRLHPATPTPAASATATPTPAAIVTPTPKEETISTGAATGTPSPALTVPEKTETGGTGSVAYTFTNLGGGISSLKLLKHQGAKPGEEMVLNRNASHPIGALLQKPDSKENEGYELKVVGKDQVILEKTEKSGLKVKKVYTLNREPKGEYRVGLEITFTNPSEAAVDYPEYYVFVGAASPIHAADYANYIGFDWFDGHSNSFTTTAWFNAGKIPLVGVETSSAKSTYVQSPVNVVWAGVRDQYFTSMLLPVDGIGKGVLARPLPLKMDNQDVKGIEGFLQMPGFSLKKGETATKKFTIYSGPAEYNQLSALGHGAVEMMNLDRFWITRTVGMILLRSMNALQSVLHSYAWAIIVLTFIVRGVLWPIQGKANRSMKRMQLLTPKQTELREKYKDDPARMNQEVMKLYKDYGVNPLSGCLPMLIQIPIFIGFYSMLGTAVELRGSTFLWVHDLASPDTVGLIPGLGFPLNILPLLMAGTMIWQMQLTPKAGDPAQQKMMAFMPLVFVFITYSFASALALYYTVSNVLSIVQLYVNRKQPLPTLEKVPSGKKKNRQ